MEAILDKVKCVQCKGILQSPIILPCMRSICAKHVPSKHETKFYNCSPCGQAHYIPEKGYPPNQTVTRLIDLHLTSYKRALSACETLEASVNAALALNNDPQGHIERVIDELRVEVCSKRDELLAEIETRSERILAQLDAYQDECATGLLSAGECLGSVECDVKEKKASLASFRGELLGNMDGGGGGGGDVRQKQRQWESIYARCELETTRLLGVVEKLKNSLLMGKLEVYRVKNEKFRELRLVEDGFGGGGGCQQNNNEELQVETVESSADVGCARNIMDQNVGDHFFRKQYIVFLRNLKH